MAGDLSPLSITRAIGGAALSRTDRLNERVSLLYETHRDAIYRFLVAQGIPPSAAEEVTQDVFVKLFIALRNGTEIVSEQGWLFGVAAKSAVDHWRRQPNSAVNVEIDCGSANTLQSREPSPEMLAQEAERLRRVANALVNLPKEQRLCIQLRSEGLRYREIAGIMGVALSTVAGWLSTAVERLRGAAHD